MTMPNERTRALINARELLRDISKMTSAANVNALRQRAAAVLRHYPDDGMISLIAAQSAWLEWPWRDPGISAQQADDECAGADDMADFAAKLRAVLASNPMTAAQLVTALVCSEPNSHVLFLTHYADVEEADGVRQVSMLETAWTHERGEYRGDPYDVWYPRGPVPREDSYQDVTYEAVRVVVLSDGPTNLRFIRQ
ncbi:BPSL0761 family protein [Burkholderia sp. BCC1970]|uniref:BPSL0761 family protein n=1 Tax=Burkholderia sp. BCC1970 TaxID=2817437 RepID=UPI002ABD7B19|nr:BPSL0761 family protein [Burkholderia sp. BCC1970]